MNFGTQTALCGALVAVGALSASSTSYAYELDQKRNEIKIESVKDFQKCVGDMGVYGTGKCLDGLQAFIGGHKSDALAAAKAVRLNMTHSAALPFFKIALNGKSDAKICGDDDLRLAVVSGLALPPTYDNFKDAQDITENLCFNTLKEGLIKEVATGSSSYFRTNTCAIFQTKGVTEKSCEAKPVVAEATATGPAKEVAALGQVDPSTLKIKKDSLKVFEGEEGHRVTMIDVLPENSHRVLVKFEGFKGPWNGKTRLHIVRDNDRSGDSQDFVTLHDGHEWVSIAKRNGRYEAVVAGEAGSQHIAWSRKESPQHAKASADGILNEFRSSTKRSTASE